MEEIGKDRGALRSDLVNNTWVVIPAYNEEKAIGAVLSRVRQYYSNVVVIDDGSRDGTYIAAAEAGVTVLRHIVNLGQGAALQTGIDYAVRMGAKFVATFDADGQHKVENIFDLTRCLVESDSDVALGSRFLGSGEKVPLRRRLLLKAAILYSNFTTGLKLTDTHCGLRVLSASAATQIRLRQDRMAHASEILSQFAEYRLKYVEAPVEISYTAYSMRKGQSAAGALDILIDSFMAWLKK